MATSALLKTGEPRAKGSMTVDLLKRLLQKCCRHRFSWPHTGVYGQDYQVCLICGAAYEFDCATMQRTGRLVEPENLRQQPVSVRTRRVSQGE